MNSSRPWTEQLIPFLSKSWPSGGALITPQEHIQKDTTYVQTYGTSSTVKTVLSVLCILPRTVPVAANGIGTVITQKKEAC